jgi:DNA repair exonuclease SbcCD ATPase subunit
MSNQDKKQIIDKMFGFSILNDMQMSIKTERRAVKMEIDSYEGELNQIIDSIASVRGRLNTLLEESQQKNNSKIDELKTSLISLNESVKILDIDKKEIETLITGNTGVYETTRSVASKTKHEIEYLKRKLELYESGKCPTCETQLDSQWHLEQKEHFCTKIESETSNIKILKENLEDIKSDIEILKGQKRDIEKNTSDIRYNMKAFRSELLKIKDTPDDTQFEHLKNLIKDFEKKEDIKSTNKGNLSADHAFMEIVENVLGEDGVKNLAVKTILPGLNSNIAAMAQTMHLQFHIRFDEKFNCIINHLGEDINPMTLSTGERKKADFIIIIAIIKILKLRFPQLNLLFLDELLSSVDHDGVYNILKILNQVIKENNLNTFVINHSVLPHEIFDKKLQIYRENGFSKFTIESIE